jgi:hypothetical protein
MSGYTILYSDPSKNNNPILVLDGTKNTQSTSLTLVGKNYPGYGEAIQTDLVHILENFAGTSPPSNPIEGQLWFDTSDPNNKKLRINDGGISGAKWSPINGLFQQPTEPTNVKVGDVWVDTGNQQLKIYNGSNFTLVGPNYSSTTRTGSYPVAITDIYGQAHNVIINYVNDAAVEIITADEFTPNPIIDGFLSLSPGINVSNANLGTLDNPRYSKINGTANSAYHLQISIPSNQSIPADSFLRNDIDQRTVGTVSIANDTNSLKIGVDPTFILERKNQYNATFLNTYDGGRFTFDIIKSGITNSVLTLEGSNQRVGVNISSPVTELDVKGSLNVSSSGTFDTLYIASTAENISGLPGNAVQIQGGVGVKGTLNVKGEHILKGPLTVGDNPVTTPSVPNTSIIVPSQDQIYDIGDPTVRWRNVYGKTFLASPNSNDKAQFVGNADTATKLQQAKPFQILGDVTSAIVSFDGSQSAYYFTTTVQTSLVTSKNSTATTTATDLLLVYSTSTQQLYRHTKKDFLKDVNYRDLNAPLVGYSTPSGSLVPPGTILPHGGNSAPPGWLICDGSVVQLTDYTYLCTNILAGYLYGGSGSNFNLPNLVGKLDAGGVPINYIIKY